MKKYLNSGYLILFLILALVLNCSKEAPTVTNNENFNGEWKANFISPAGSGRSLQSATLEFSISGETATLTHFLLITDSAVQEQHGTSLQATTLNKNKLLFQIDNYTFYILLKNNRVADISLDPL